MSRSSGVETVEFRDGFRCMDIVLVNPGVLLIAVSSPLYQELEFPPEYATISDCLYFVFLFSSVVNQDWGRWYGGFSAWYRVLRSAQEFYDVEDRMESGHRAWKSESICIFADLSEDFVGPDITMCEFVRWSRGSDVA